VFAKSAKGDFKLSEQDKKVAISLRNLTRNFRDFTAVSDLSLDLPYGEIIGFLGPNGAGKSTTMKMIAGLIKPSEGEIIIGTNGETEKLTSFNKDRILSHVGFLIENPTFYGHMTPRQILRYFAELKGYPRKQIKARVEEVVKLVGLTDWIDKKIKTFSKGMRQKIGLASALVHDPEILVLDEPQTGLDPKARKETRELLLSLKKQGKTIFLSSHLLYEVSEISDKIGIINHGKLIAFDTVKNLEKNVKKSTLQIELLHAPEDLEGKINQMTELISPIVKAKKNEEIIQFKPELNLFEVSFDGSAEKKNEILEVLQDNGIRISGISVPRTNLLESLYIDFMAEDDEIEVNLN